MKKLVAAFLSIVMLLVACSALAEEDERPAAGVIGCEGLEAMVDLCESGVRLYRFGSVCAWACLVSVILGAAASGSSGLALPAREHSRLHVSPAVLIVCHDVSYHGVGGAAQALFPEIRDVLIHLFFFVFGYGVSAFLKLCYLVPGPHAFLVVHLDSVGLAGTYSADKIVFLY